LVVPITATYSVSLEQHSNVPLLVEVTDLRSAEGEEEINPFERATFIEVPSAISGTATMELNYSAGLASLQLLIDLDQDGLPDQIITRPPSWISKGYRISPRRSPPYRSTVIRMRRGFIPVWFPSPYPRRMGQREQQPGYTYWNIAWMMV